MALTHFAEALRSGEAIRLAPLPASGPTPLAGDELSDIREFLEAWDRDRREELPRPLPPLSLSSARWSILICYRAMQAWVSPALNRTALRSMLRVPAPELPDAQSAYSVDLALRYLPLLLRRGARMAAPFWVDTVRELLKPWPLSALGVNIESPAEAYSFLQHRSLCRLYVDRCLQRGVAIDSQLSQLPQQWRPRVREEHGVAVGGRQSRNPHRQAVSAQCYNSGQQGSGQQGGWPDERP